MRDKSRGCALSALNYGTHGARAQTSLLVLMMRVLAKNYVAGSEEYNELFIFSMER